MYCMHAKIDQPSSQILIVYLPVECNMYPVMSCLIMAEYMSSSMLNLLYSEKRSTVYQYQVPWMGGSVCLLTSWPLPHVAYGSTVLYWILVRWTVFNIHRGQVLVRDSHIGKRDVCDSWYQYSEYSRDVPYIHKTNWCIHQAGKNSVLSPC